MKMPRALSLFRNENRSFLGRIEILGRARLCGLMALGLGFALSGVTRAQMITLAPGVVNPPPPLTSLVPEKATADTATLVKLSDFTAKLSATLTAQGFTALNNWVYSLNATDLPAGLVNPVASPANEKFNITTYNLYLDPAKMAFGETMDFSLINAPLAPVLAGATITAHWIQVLNEDRRYNDFGYSLAGLSGIWKLDNGSTAGGGAGAGPFYDSNAPAGSFSTPPDFHDSPHYFSGDGTYFHATTFESWDVAVGGKDYLVLADTGISWGFSITGVPEPSTWAGGIMCILICCYSIFKRRARHQASA